MSQENAGGPSRPPKAIASLAKKQSDVTRMGTQKLKFVPTLPARRKKEGVTEETAVTSVTSADRGRGRGRGRGEERGRGRGRGDALGRGVAPARPPQVEMTASGPFALGPAMMGMSGTRRTVPRSNFAPTMPGGVSRGPMGGGLSNASAPWVGIKREANELSLPKQETGVLDDDGEAYSDPEEGVEIVDMENVRGMDWMAPESLRKDKIKRKGKSKKQDVEMDTKGKGAVRAEVGMDESVPKRDVDGDGVEEPSESKINLANALNLSDSEEEEELEDIIHDFASRLDTDLDDSTRQELLYFFQFPSPFPKFFSASSASAEEKGNVKGAHTETGSLDTAGKKVSFAPRAEPAPTAVAYGQNTPAQPGADTKQVSGLHEKVEGIIGQLEMYASGTVKMRLANGIVLDVSGSTQPTFLQHATYVDAENKRICVLGEVNRRFVVSPDVETLLQSLQDAEKDHIAAELVGLDNLITMDTT
ncbi:RNA polymerase III RPC4-domain-containing protein [Cytidiella melzeri]|nr:RNA polymerase III RPC4-domain-containing protein [Cytidiella melzeri]